jgi:glycosyltransferase involved in cell wall biosynthesis
MGSLRPLPLAFSIVRVESSKVVNGAPSILILGTRGIPASHGGFETFAERLALFLAERGWNVSVYCQKDVERVTQRITRQMWRGVALLNVEVASKGPAATLEFDWQCVRDAARRPGISLVLGYNGAIFLPWLRLAGGKIITNMDGVEWRRPKWSLPIRVWFWVNEWIAAWTSQRLVADHPAIADHLATRRNRGAIAMIPYGGNPVVAAPDAPVRAMGLEPQRYFVSIARIEPDNNILTMVEAFSRRRRNAKLVVLGKLDADNAYHCKVRAAASKEVVFPGAIYEAAIVEALRFHARAYVHGHIVGGTNPSLVEALAAGNAVIAHDNIYNRWTAGAAAVYFSDADGFERNVELYIADDTIVARAQAAARVRAAAQFDWSDVLEAYEREAFGLLDRPFGQASSAPLPAPTQSRPLQ